MKEHNFSIRKLEEYSILHNKAISVFNKPKNQFNNRTGFNINLQARY